MQKLPLLILALLFILPAPPSAAQTVDEALNTSAALYKEKRYLDALVLMDRMLEKYPGNVRLLLEQAALTDAKGDRIGAFRKLFEAEALYPDNDTIINSIAHLYEFSGHLDSALANYKRGLGMARNRSDSFDARLNIGSVYLFMQRYAQGRDHYLAMQREFPDSLSVLTNLAQAYADNGEKPKAVALMEKIIRKDPAYQGACNNLGLLCTQMGDYKRANEAFQTGLKATPDDALLLNNYGFLLYKTKEYQKALLYINKSISIYSTNPYAYRNRALVYLDMKLKREACADLDASAELGFSIYYGDEVDKLKAANCGTN